MEIPKTYAQIYSENGKGKDRLRNLGVDGRVNSKMNLKEIGFEGIVSWIQLAKRWVQGRSIFKIDLQESVCEDYLEQQGN
jgi:hypothetical protein